MSTDEKDYSDYIKHLSNLGSMLSFFSGFMFTSITILLTQLPDPTQIRAQVTLFFLAAMLDIFIFLMADSYQKVVYLCKNVPPYSGRITPTNLLMDISMILGFGGSTVLLFLLWNLIYLALAQVIAWALVTIAAYISTMKPFYKKPKHRKTISS